MKHFKIIGSLWFLFGLFGFLFSLLHTVLMASFIYSIAGLGALLVEILQCVFLLAAVVTGVGLLRQARWSRVATEVLGSILFAVSAIALIFSEVATSQRVSIFVPALLFALYSLAVTLFVRYEPEAG
jgi:hypothetical protein